jgi:hypothetical protein
MTSVQQVQDIDGPRRQDDFGDHDVFGHAILVDLLDVEHKTGIAAFHRFDTADSSRKDIRHGKQFHQLHSDLPNAGLEGRLLSKMDRPVNSAMRASEQFAVRVPYGKKTVNAATLLTGRLI